MSSLVKEFNDYRTRMNQGILSKNNLVIKRLWNLDTNTYENGVLDTKTNERLGLVVRRGGCYVVMILSSFILKNVTN